ncbi:hypothetical protein [Pseudocitrobacter cyperus]|uniref:Glycogen synthesis protein GlgS n=1 Tax=Pseudocitrobacter cyperus TaxID=3112843 RepID=A0ABV0HNV6_9ENTR
MFEFCPKSMKTNVDFIAFTVAKMEYEQRGLCARAVVGNMPLDMSEHFQQRLHFYRDRIEGAVSPATDRNSASNNDVIDYR